MFCAGGDAGFLVRGSGETADAVQEQRAGLLLEGLQAVRIVHIGQTGLPDGGTDLAAAPHVQLYIGSAFNRATVQTTLDFP